MSLYDRINIALDTGASRISGIGGETGSNNHRGGNNGSGSHDGADGRPVVAAMQASPGHGSICNSRSSSSSQLNLCLDPAPRLSYSGELRLTEIAR